MHSTLQSTSRFTKEVPTRSRSTSPSHSRKASRCVSNFDAESRFPNVYFRFFFSQPGDKLSLDITAQSSSGGSQGVTSRHEAHVVVVEPHLNPFAPPPPAPTKGTLTTVGKQLITPLFRTNSHLMFTVGNFFPSNFLCLANLLLG